MLAAAAPFISAGANVVGAIAGLRQANAAARAQREANNLAVLNWLQNKQSADLQRELALAGQINARGDRTEYVPGVGWVVTPAPFTRGLQTVADSEAAMGYAVDQPRARAEEREAFLRRLAAGADANAARAGRTVGAQSLDDVRSSLIEQGFAEADSGADNLRNAIGVNAIRTGSGGEVALANAARDAIANRRVALARARAAAPGAFVNARGAQTAMAEEAIAAPMRRASGQTSARLVGGDFDRLNGSAAAELATRFLARGGQTEAPRLGYADDRTGLGIGALGGAIDNLLMQISRSRKKDNDVKSKLEGIF